MTKISLCRVVWILLCVQWYAISPAGARSLSSIAPDHLTYGSFELYHGDLPLVCSFRGYDQQQGDCWFDFSRYEELYINLWERGSEPQVIKKILGGPQANAKTEVSLLLTGANATDFIDYAGGDLSHTVFVDIVAQATRSMRFGACLGFLWGLVPAGWLAWHGRQHIDRKELAVSALLKRVFGPAWMNQQARLDLPKVYYEYKPMWFECFPHP
ncbi:MAG: hypothetical protein OXT67_09155, partial [Zetaproteobacteria bacterium]|nr:hypothetical protein [Zetaproteobacteria bacterium]